MLTDLTKAPFPYYGGKKLAAPIIWAALGDVDHFVEPFAGSMAVLLGRPHAANRAYHSETVNDAHGLLVNALRSIQHSPDATADAASWYVSEADIMARQLAILDWAKAGNLERLMADPAWHDPQIGGWWLYGLCGWIGSGWCAGDGPWVVGADGRVTRQPKAGGVARKLPHLGDDGKGVHHAGTREPGVATGAGAAWDADADGLIIPDDLAFHPRVMPELTRWFQFLSARLRHVRIVNGDWTRVCTTGAMYTLPVRQGGVAGVFLDPPYAADTGRAMGLYADESADVAHAVRAWCLKMGNDPRLRIVLAGFDTEHQELESHGWRVVEWFTDGFLTGGMANQSANGHQQHRERLWLSPHCIQASITDLPLFTLLGNEDD